MSSSLHVIAKSHWHVQTTGTDNRMIALPGPLLKLLAMSLTKHTRLLTG